MIKFESNCASDQPKSLKLPNKKIHFCLIARTYCHKMGALVIKFPIPRRSDPAPGPDTHKNFSKFKGSVTMIMGTLYSMAYGLFKPFWLIDVLCTCFKETTPLFNVHLSCFVDFILCPTDKYMFKVNNKKNWLICWICSKLKVNTAWHRLGVFILKLDHSHHINVVFLLLTLKTHFSAV